MSSQSLLEKLKAWTDKTVVVQSTFPIPTPNGVIFAPCKGVLKEVFSDGFSLEDSGNMEVFVLANVRSVLLYEERMVHGVKRGGIIT